MGRIDRLRAAVATAEESFGPDDHRTLAARLALGRGFHEVPNEAEAYAELAALADDCTRDLGPEPADTLIARYEAGMACLGLHTFQRHPDPQRLPEAIWRLEKVAADRERLHGATHPDTLRTWRNLAHAYSTAERYTGSRSLNERILAGWNSWSPTGNENSAPMPREPRPHAWASPAAWDSRRAGYWSNRFPNRT